MNRKMVGILISVGIFVAGLAGAARAQNSPGVAGMDSALRGAVERHDVPAWSRCSPIAGACSIRAPSA